MSIIHHVKGVRIQMPRSCGLFRWSLDVVIHNLLQTPVHYHGMHMVGDDDLGINF